jgi:N6-L-threonylcarbamoyladenine synthase
MRVYINNLKNWEFDKKGPVNLRSQRVTIAKGQGTSGNENSQANPTRSKTHSSSCLCILGIETTCDETAASVVVDGVQILSNVIASQAAIHRPYGGVYPEIAAREHVEAIIPTIDCALKEASVSFKEIDLIAVAKGPGLIGPLLVGINAAKTLSMAWEIPFVGVNHVEAHLYAAMMSHQIFQFPSLGLVISGGHTFLVEIFDVGHYALIGTTVDDAVGEAFDKVAALLGLSYPGGPQVEELAKKGDPTKYPFKAGVVKKHPWDFSFSGLKTSVLYAIKGQNGDKNAPSLLSEQEKKDVAASFQEAALNDIVTKTLNAAKANNSKAIYVGGGVSNNLKLREKLQADIPIYWPNKGLSLDNAAMIAGLGFHTFKGKGDPYTLEPETRSQLFSPALTS